VGRKARWHAVNDTGSMTGVATAILALLSAGTVASITFVGVQQLAPAISERPRTAESAAVRAPAKVVVTPRVVATTAGSEIASHHRASKPRTSSPSDVSVVPAVLTSPAARIPTHTPRVTLPRVHVHRPAVTIPAVTIPAVTIPAVTVPAVAVAPVPTVLAPAPSAPTLTLVPAVNARPVPGIPQVASSGHGRSAFSAATPVRQAAVAVLGEKLSAASVDGTCGEHSGGDHHQVDGDRGREHGSDGCGDDHGRGHSGCAGHDRNGH
jgi:hypothetical protein